MPNFCIHEHNHLPPPPLLLPHHHRQSPCGFDLGGTRTLDWVGADRVQVHTGRDTDNKRIATLQIWCFCLSKDKWMLQPRICIIFPGLGGPHYDKEREQYDKRVVVMFQKKAWLDRPTARAYVRLMAPDIDRLRVGVGAKPDELGMAFHDNLDAQTQEEYVLRRAWLCDKVFASPTQYTARGACGDHESSC